MMYGETKSLIVSLSKERLFAHQLLKFSWGLGVLCVLGLSGCNKKLTRHKPVLPQVRPSLPVYTPPQRVFPEAEPQATTVKIGVLLPLSKKFTTEGLSLMNGLEMAFFNDTLLKNLKNQGKAPQLLIYDTEGNPDKVVAAIQALEAAQVRLIIGPYTQEEIKTALHTREKTSTVPIFTFSSRGNVSSTSQNIYEAHLSLQQHLIKTMTDVGARKDMVIFIPEDDYTDINRALLKRQRTVPFCRYRSVGDYHCFRHQINGEVKFLPEVPAYVKNAKIWMIVDQGLSLHAFLDELKRKLGTLPPVLISSGCWTTGMATAPEGVFFLSLPPTAAQKEFVDQYQEIYKTTGNYTLAILAYDTLCMILTALVSSEDPVFHGEFYGKATRMWLEGESLYRELQWHRKSRGKIFILSDNVLQQEIDRLLASPPILSA